MLKLRTTTAARLRAIAARLDPPSTVIERVGLYTTASTNGAAGADINVTFGR